MTEAKDGWTLATEGQFAGRTLENTAGLRVRVLANGCVQTIEAGPTLVNLFVGQPIGGGVGRLVIRRIADGAVAGWWSMVGPDAKGQVLAGASSILWRGQWAAASLSYEVRLSLHESALAWSWSVTLSGGAGDTFDVVMLQDVGIAGRGQIQNNEAYTSQYIDHRLLQHERAGWVAAARQNLAQEGGRHPWLISACTSGAAGAVTDGQDFFGSAYRATGAAALLNQAAWPSRVRQGEVSCQGLLSRPVVMDRELVTVRFVHRLVEDHPEATGSSDVALLDDFLKESAWPVAADQTAEAFTDRSDVTGTLLWSGDEPSEQDLVAWFDGAWSVQERIDGKVGSFFTADGSHVVTRAKELAVLRRHGHVMMEIGGAEAQASRLPNEAVLCDTAYACGIFASHICLGNTSFNKLLSVARDLLNIVRDSGLRIYVEVDGRWRQLGVASAFAMARDGAAWVYRFGDEVWRVEATIRRGKQGAAELVYTFKGDGPARRLLLAGQLVLGDRENDTAGHVEIDQVSATARLTPSEHSMMGRSYPASSFEWSVADPAALEAFGGDELLFADGQRRGLPFLTIRTVPSRSLQWSIRGDIGVEPSGAGLGGTAVSIDRSPSQDVTRLAEALPWLEHNAAIHLTAPHGIEQYGGAAWGVRDVCQGPLEWLAARGDHATCAAILKDVFSHQYARRGDWPQWYMHPPFANIQSSHCHGDVAVWPLIATAQYLESTDDTALLDAAVPYTDDETFAFSDDAAPILDHLKKAVGTLVAQFVPGTSLLRYGDGDWNDSLQPVRQAQRQRMVSTWTVMLMHQALRRLAPGVERHGDRVFAEELLGIADAVRRDIQERLILDGESMGLYLHDDDPAKASPLLHPRDTTTGIHHRLLPMIRGVISESFDAKQAAHHHALINKHLLAPDGARLFDTPPTYHGGTSLHFQRAESASYFGREIGIMYTHAHLRYAQAMAHLGQPEALLTALQTINPVGLSDTVPNALPRQANAYFSSSDADVATRSEAEQRYSALKRGDVPVQGGWRVYSSGPGIVVGLIARHLLGIRRRFDRLVIDPVLTPEMTGMTATMDILGRPTRLTFTHTGSATATLNGQHLDPVGTEANPYRTGGMLYDIDAVHAVLTNEGNTLEIGY